MKPGMSAWRGAAFVIGLVPWGWLGPLGAFVGWLAGSVLRIRRSHVESAMRRAGVAAPLDAARGMYRALGHSAVEFLWLSSRGKKALAHVTLAPGSHAIWMDAMARGRGVVVAASHTGNWDLAACAVAAQVDLVVVTKSLRLRSLDSFWHATRARHGVLLMPPKGAMARAHAALGRGSAVAMMTDQVPASPRHGLSAPFLGQAAWLDRAPAAVAARAGSPLVVAACCRTSAGDHELHVLAVLVPPPHAGRQWIDVATLTAAQALERFVLAHPSQWLWLHRRWRHPAAARVDRSPRRGTLDAPCKTRSSSPAVASRVV